MMALLLPLLLATVVLISWCSAAALAARVGSDPYAWIRDIELHGGVHRLEARTYHIDRVYVLPNDTQIIGAGSKRGSSGSGTTMVVATATRPEQQGGHFHGCGPNQVNRIGFVLGSRCRISGLHYVGIERARYPDSHPMW